jgi:hypothetical protein
VPRPSGVTSRMFQNRPDRVEVAGLHCAVARRELRGPRVAELVAVTDEHVENRHLLAFRGLGVIVTVERVATRGQEPQVAPATLAREVADPVWIGLRDDGEVQQPAEVESGAVERVQNRGARRAGGLRERKRGRLALRRSGPGVARVPREHEAVDDERVLARLEQLAEPDLAPVGRVLEAVVVGHGAARRQPAPLRRDLLDRPPQLGLGTEQAIALATVLLGLAGETNARVHVGHLGAFSCVVRDGARGRAREV